MRVGLGTCGSAGDGLGAIPYYTQETDTGTQLSFYGPSGDDLEELRKLGAVMKAKKVRLNLPEQTAHEFTRNGPAKIAAALQRLRGQKSPLEPQEAAGAAGLAASPLRFRLTDRAPRLRQYRHPPPPTRSRPTVPLALW